MEHDMTKWNEVADLLAYGNAYRDPEVELQKKEKYICRWLPELQDGTSRYILDIGAGTGAFCHACQELGHTTLAVLSVWKPDIGYRKACIYYGVKFIDFTWGTEPAPLEDNSFDVVNSQGMMGDNAPELWPDIFDDMLRVLKPGGILLLAANRESGTQYADIITNWSEEAAVKQIKYHGKQTVWKWIKKS